MIPKRLYKDLLKKYHFKIFGGECTVDLTNPLYTLPLDVKKFPKRFQHLLSYSKIKNLGPLLNLPYVELLNLPNLGKTSLGDVLLILDETLTTHNLCEMSHKIENTKPFKENNKVISSYRDLRNIGQISENNNAAESSTLSNSTFVEALESEFEHLHPDLKEKLILRVRDDLTLTSIAVKFGLTRERIRQIVEKGINLLSHKLVPYKGSLEQDIILRIVDDPGLVKQDFFTPKVLGQSFIYRLIVNMYDHLPLEGNKLNLSNPNINKRYKQFIDKASLILHSEESMKFGQFVNNLYTSFPNDIMKALMVVLSWDEVVITKGEFVHQISMRPRNLPSKVTRVLSQSQVPLTLDELLVRTGHRSFNISSLKSVLENNSRFFRIDEDKFGMEKHLSLSKSEINKVLESVAEILEAQGKSVHINLIIEKVRIDFPRLQSRYELYYILKNSGKYISHRGMSLSLKTSRNNVREIKEIVTELLSTKGVPVYKTEIIEKINEERFFNEAGWSSTVKTIEGVHRYHANYYGLYNNHELNIEYLSGDTNFIVRAIEKHVCPSTTYEKIIDFFKIYNLEKVKEILETSTEIKFLESMNNTTKFAVSKNWVYGTVVKTILYHHDSGVMSQALLQSYLKTIDLSVQKGYRFKNFGIVYLAKKRQFVLLRKEILDRKEQILRDYIEFLNNTGFLPTYGQITTQLTKKLNFVLSKYEVEAIDRLWIKSIIAKESTK